jgi:hypothetical protein
MSVAPGKVTCTGCTFQGSIHWRPVTVRYQLPTGETADSLRVFGWCAACDQVRDIEARLDPDALEADLQAARQSREAQRTLIQWALGKQSQVSPKEVALAVLLKVAKTRLSSPRCLDCGQENAVELHFDHSGKATDFVHRCGGLLRLVSEDEEAPRFFYRSETIVVDIEGRSLQDK